MRLQLATITVFSLLFTEAQSDGSESVAVKLEDCNELYGLSLSLIEQHVWAPLARFRRLEPACGSVAMYGPLRAQLESFVGNHRETLKFWDKNHFPKENDEASPGNEQDKGIIVRAVEAVPHILHRASDHQIVIVNERHHVSKDRLLTLSLLEPLFELGYRYLAVEAVWNGDAIDRRGYPTKTTGYYVSDVVFGEMLREAISLGYRVVGYEIDDNQKSESPPPSRQSRRDYWQARNLVERTLVTDDDAKVVVHCGWGHVEEQVTSHWQPMAYFLREITGIDPLTVDQTLLSERSDPRLEHPWRTEAERRNLIDSAAVVLVREDGEPIEIGTGVDIRVLSPRTVYRNSRPTWMEISGRRRPVTVIVPECARTHCIVEARNAKRDDEIAYDRAEVVETEFVTLYLPNNASVELFLFGLDGELYAKRNILR